MLTEVSEPSSSSSTTMGCPWKKTQPVVSNTSFRELMDSDLAAKLQKEEEDKYAHQLK